MKLLIVDDEKLTREGILKSLPLEKLGIHQTFLADDGIHGLKIALKEKPDLILTRRAHAPHERRGNGRGDT